MPVYITDAAGAYDHAWITVKKVDVVGRKEAVTVYDDPVGKMIDLVPLAGTVKQQFALLGIARVAAEPSFQVRVTVDQSVTLVPTGASEGTTYTFAGSASGSKTFTISVGHDPRGVVADFDVANWQIADGQIVGVVKGGDISHVGPGDHAHQNFRGTVSHLSGSAPTVTFDLTHGNHTLHVTANDQTILSNSDGSQNPVLANGANVRVAGTFGDRGSFTITASEIEIHKAPHQRKAFAEGIVRRSGTDSFTMTPRHVDRFHPRAHDVHVSTSADSLFFKNGVSMTGAEFFAAISHGSRVMVHGAYDRATNTIAAAHINLIERHENRHHVGVHGTVSGVDPAAGTFNLTLRGWEGAQLHVGDVVQVVTNDQTRFVGVALDHLRNGQNVRVVGDLNRTTITAALVHAGHHD